MPDFADLHRQRQRHAHLTQKLLWEEYRQANPDAEIEIMNGKQLASYLNIGISTVRRCRFCVRDRSS
jgi:hypothetical protein